MTRPISKLPQSGRERGFTLLELMVTLVVVAILATAAFPFYRSFITTQLIKSTSFDIMASLTLARSEAIKRNASMDVQPTNGNWSQGWTLVLSGTTTIVKTQTAPKSGLSIVCYSGSTVVTPCPTITYNNNGRISGAAAPSIWITTTDPSVPANSVGQWSRCINIDLSGRPLSKKATCP